MTRYFEAVVGESPLIEFKLQLDGLPRDISTGFTLTLTVENDEDGSIATPIELASDEEGADWAIGVVTARVLAELLDAPKRLLIALVVSRDEDSVEDVPATGVIVVRHRPGLADEA